MENGFRVPVQSVEGTDIEVTLSRTEGQIFRERVGFLLLCVIGVYCSMRILVELKSILEPFLWALFLVMAWKPVVDALETQLDRGLAYACFRCRCTERKSHCEPAEELANVGEDDGLLGHQRIHQTDDTFFGKMATGDGELNRGALPRGSRIHNRQMSSNDMDGDDEDLIGGRSKLRKTASRILAVMLVFLMTVAILTGFVSLILESARHMRDHWSVYQKGARNLTTETLRILSYVLQKMPDNVLARYESVTTDIMKTAQDLIYGLLGDVLNNIGSLLLGGSMTMLYTLFWLCSPVPIHSSIDAMFRRYIMFKTLACCGFGICVGVLLSFLSVDLASLFALTTFLLNYVPEVGPFVAMVLPCPLIMLDSRLENPFLVMITAVIGQLALKFAFSNIIEVKLIESDKKLRMHPVMILVSVGIFGFLWGPTGMLLSVPLMALVKVSLFSDLVPSSYRDPILILLEGDRDAPRRHALQPDLRLPQSAPPGG